MANLTIVAAFCGKGEATYEAGEFELPAGLRRFADEIDTVATHGGVFGRKHWSDPVVNGLKGGLALASSLELSGTLSLAAGALGAGLATFGGGDSKPRTLVEITFLDGATIVALTDDVVPALMLNDREVVRRVARRGSPMVPASDEAASILSGASDAIQATGSAAVSALSDAAASTLAGAYALFRSEPTSG